MKYRLNDHIIFDVDTGTLSLAEFSDDPISISNPSKRLLLLLITHHGEAVCREVIFKKVWDDYGMVSGNNNLNQCVSKLRRVIKNLGIEEEVIATVPKVGFMLRYEIVVEPCDGPEDSFADEEMPVVARISEQPEIALAPAAAGTVYAGYSRRWWAIVSLVTLGVMMLVVAIGSYLTGSVPRQEIYLGKANNCKVFMSMPGASTAVSAGLSRDILAYAAPQTAVCSGDEFLLVVRSNQVRSYISGISRLFFLRCRILREHRVEVCSGLESDNAAIIN
ncbi:DNA-binding transcriptional activator CadC [Serratia quinivorans]|jgi:DNA-binding winged helix-turn-helix (wHTH) protein|uniref:winged helix-turn-helix domain-containing protein n=1 Tax=Serratia quinivorans TaxID=137545 RepID=UPI002178EE4B|nr:winged helix-turn-helix domain-containing protein [Serratia quinivorans]CAI0760876.1 DNA-binding transcriptional activator CadC [Serratia quinivorans]CAI0813117.1 DNA-binding transcriptional activator CadC [Serratia quinivorans]CAI0929364.1 DNA-binding transcriptional activator CadC [Serratia quinivorans]CAI0946729.1 DNA-binding transcriptional activator CadC [Serratia quinivorans]CAI1148275.1 DNA-binding transcriptional activator CadC [Serratia quinivorans]